MFAVEHSCHRPSAAAARSPAETAARTSDTSYGGAPSPRTAAHSIRWRTR